MQFADDTQTLRSADPGQVADALGLAPDPQAQRQKGGSGYLYFRAPDGESIVVCVRSRAGVPIWWQPGDAAHAQDWLGLVQHLHPNLTLGHAKAYLRRALGSTAPRTPKPVPSPLPTAAQPSAPPILGPEPTWLEPWLQSRGISRETIEAARDTGGLRGYTHTTTEGRQFTNAAFPHTNAHSDLVGAETRGQGGKFKGYTGSKTALPGFFLLPALQGASRLCIVEGAVDALALSQYLCVHNKPDAHIIATAGRPSHEQLEQVQAFGADLGVELLIAAHDRDQDGAGDAQSALFAPIADAIGAEFRRVKPPAGHKDWAAWTESQQPRAA